MSDMSYQQQAQSEMYDAIAEQEVQTKTFRVIDSKTRVVLMENLPSLGHAQDWRDRWERRNRGKTAICDSL